MFSSKGLYSYFKAFFNVEAEEALTNQAEIQSFYDISISLNIMIYSN